jgi:hypothetical protein
MVILRYGGFVMADPNQDIHSDFVKEGQLQKVQVICREGGKE